MATIDVPLTSKYADAVVSVVDVCAQGCHATVRIAVGGYSEDRQIDMEALYRDKPNADTIDQVMWNLRTAMRMDRVSPDTLSTYLKTRSFKV